MELEYPATIPHWIGLRVALQSAVGAAFGMVAGQALEYWAGGRPRPPGVFAWGGAIAGAVIGGATQYAVERSKLASA